MPKRRQTRQGRRSPRGQHPFYDSYEIKVRPHRSLWVQLLLVPWRWRNEVLVVAVTWVVVDGLTRVMSPIAALVAMTIPVALMLTLPRPRRIVTARFWCSVTRHRLRACMVQLRTTNWDGRLPWVLWVRPTPVGERAWLLMMPGLSATDLEDRTEHLAAACWARDARVHRVRSLAALVRVDVIRRDPLTRPEPITNPLMDRTSDLPAADTAAAACTATALPVPVGAAPASENTAPESATPISTTNRRTKRNERPEARSAAVMVNGEDVSDYV
jgi:hypothetical protein